MPYEQRTEIYKSDQQLYPSADSNHNALMTGHHLSHLINGRFVSGYLLSDKSFYFTNWTNK